MMTAAEVHNKIKKNLPFVRGITVSGGEATLYPQFLTELFSLIRAEGKTTMIDANGTIDLSEYPQLMEVTDGVMLDIKAWDPDVFERLTLAKATGKLAKNIRFLAEHNKLSELRLVYLDGYVDAFACIEKTAQLIPEYIDRIKLKLIKFRNNGVRGHLSTKESPSASSMKCLADYARQLGFNKITIR